MGDSLTKDRAQFWTQALQGNRRALAQLLSLAETDSQSLLQAKEFRHPKKLAFRVGLTGPPGAGKSTLVNGLIREFRKRGKKIAVIAVDPSSPFSKGAILGDRIRFTEQGVDPNIFIRSVASRGYLGGVNPSAFLMARIFDAVGFDLVIVETVGVGQTELEVMHIADAVALVLVPESGDGIQLMKAGILEIADFIVVNKSDRPNADVLVRELEASELSAQIFSTVATQYQGIDKLIKFIDDFMSQQAWQAERQSDEHLQAEAKAILRMLVEQSLPEQLRNMSSQNVLEQLSTAKITINIR